MTDEVPALIEPPDGYGEWLADLKARVHAVQLRAALAVNTEMIQLYWLIGKEILDRQGQEGWGARITQRLSHDLREAFPDMRGFSRTNLDYMRAFAEAWSTEAISQQAVGRLPWGHNLVLLHKLKRSDERLAYAEAALEHGWSRSVLETHIATRSVERTGNAITNFDRLKAAAFKPEHVGQLGFYMAAIDGEVKSELDGPTIGLLLCKNKDEVVAEYALRNVSAPLGVSEYDLVKDLPEPLATNLPTIERIERELGEAEG